MLDAELLVLGIDDLAKFRIVQLLCARTDFAGTAEAFAGELGFRSVERTGAILAELADRRLLDRSSVSSSPPRYRLTRDAERRRALARLGCATAPSADDAHLIRRLARSSLRRAKSSPARGLLAAGPATEKETVAHGYGL